MVHLVNTYFYLNSFSHPFSRTVENIWLLNFFVTVSLWNTWIYRYLKSLRHLLLPRSHSRHQRRVSRSSLWDRSRNLSADPGFRWSRPQLRGHQRQRLHQHLFRFSLLSSWTRSGLWSTSRTVTQRWGHYKDSDKKTHTLHMAWAYFLLPSFPSFISIKEGFKKYKTFWDFNFHSSNLDYNLASKPRLLTVFVMISKDLSCDTRSI